MSRDHKKLRVFQLADELVVDVYVVTRELPAEERYGLQSQLRRAAVSAPTNIVEGCARRSTKDDAHFMGIALGSSSEVRYLLGLTRRLFDVSEQCDDLAERYGEIVRGLQKLIDALHGVRLPVACSP